MSLLLPNICYIASCPQALSPYHGCKSLEVRDCAVFISEVREIGTGSVFFVSLCVYENMMDTASFRVLDAYKMTVELL